MELGLTYLQGNCWLVGYLNDYPELQKQGKDVAELEEILLVIYENIKKMKSGRKMICILSVI